MELFEGYNTWTGQKASKIATGETSQPVDLPMVSRAVLCTDSSDLFQSLEVDASVSGSYGAFSADAKSKFYKSLKLTTNSITLLVYISTKKLNSFSTVKIDAKEEARLTDDNEISRFVGNHGDSWVASITTGTYYTAAFVFYAETKEQKSKVEASLSAKYSGGGVDASASVAVDIQKTLKETHVRCELFQTAGGVPPEVIPVINVLDPAGSAQAVMDFAKDFASKKAPNPAVVSYTVQGYETAFDANVAFQNVIDNRRAFNGGSATPGMGKDYQTLTTLNNKIEDTKAFYAFYGVSPDADFNSKKESVDTDLKTLEDLIATIGKHPTKKKNKAPALESLTYGMPQALIAFVNPPGWGAIEDTSHPPFDDVTSDMVYGRCRVAEISIRHGDRLDCLTVTYEVNGDQLEPRTHGNAKGPSLEGLQLSRATTPPEMVTMIQGYGGGWPGTSAVNRIWIETTTGQSLKTVHPDGADKGHIKDHPSSPAWTYTKGGDVLVGFKGHADNGLVILLQAVVVSFKGTQWIST